MIFDIVQKGLNLLLSTDNQVYLRVDKEYLSPETLEKYQHLLIGNELTFLKPADLVLNSDKNSCNFKSMLADVKSICITKEAILEAIEKINISSVIYTGAGISRTAGIMTCNELYNTLYINSDYNILVENYIENLEYIMAQFKMFNMRLMHSNPTIAHHKLADIVRRTKCTLISENLDNLHHKTGIVPRNPFIEKDELIKLKPDKVFLMGVGYPMCSDIFDYWYSNGAIFYAINYMYTEFSVPTNIYVGDVQEVLY